MAFPSSPTNGSIQAVNAGSSVAGLTPNSYVGMALTGTTGTFNVNGRYYGQLAVYYSSDGSTLTAVPAANIAGPGGSIGIGVGQTGQFVVTGISGSLIVLGSSLTSGIPQISMFIPNSGSPEGTVTIGPGSNLIGKVGIDQTTDGTTNGVRLTSSLPSGATYENATSNGSPITTAATVTVFAAQSGARHHAGEILVSNGGATSTAVQILDGATVVAEGYAAASGGGFAIQGPLPIIGSTNTVLSIKVLTAGASIYWTVNGYYMAGF